MWHLIGIDKDGARHHWNEAKTKEEAEILLEKAMPALNKARSNYISELIEAKDEHENIQRLPKEQRPLYYDYLGWKMQGFYIDHFILEYKEGY